MEVVLLVKADCILGESPMWHAERGSIWWVDIIGKKILEFNPQKGELSTWELEKHISLIRRIAYQNNLLLLCLEDGIASYDITSSRLTHLLDIEKEIMTNRSNDGKCDALGRLWLGTMNMDCKKGCGSVYLIDNNLAVQKKISNTTISNGLTWNLANDRLYYIDSTTYQVQSYYFDLKSGDIRFERTIIHVPKELGEPDGMAIDTEGMLWIAQWGGFGVNRWDPSTGEMIDKISVPVPNVSSCAFGGQNNRTLFITTARDGLSPEDLEKYPESGSVFVANTEVSGYPEYKFNRD